MLKTRLTGCPACHSKYDISVRVPRILHNCKHAICQECLQKTLKASAGDAFACPTCSQPNSPDPDDPLNAAYFPPSVSLIASMAGQLRAFPIEKCSRHGSLVNHLCLNLKCADKSIRCRDCAKLYHRTCPANMQIPVQHFFRLVKCESLDVRLEGLSEAITENIDAKMNKMKTHVGNFVRAVINYVNSEAKIIAEMSPATFKAHHKRLLVEFDPSQQVIMVSLRAERSLRRWWNNWKSSSRAKKIPFGTAWRM